VDPLKTHVLAAEQRALVEQTLERVLSSPAFRNSKQCQKFLRYVVEHACAGNDEHLKERSIGVELFGRDPDYDTAADPVVRVRATEVRKRLSQYYGDATVQDELRFEIPQGAYRADIHWGAPKPLPPEPFPAARHPQWPWIASLVVSLVAVAVFLMLRSRTAPTDVLTEFWAPVLDSGKPVLLYCGQPVVYFLSREVHDKYRDSLPPEKTRGSYTLPLEPEATVQGKDIIPVTDQFVGIGNAHTAAMLTGMFARRGKSVELRYGNDVSFTDLRGSPSVLIGAFSNLWTLEMTRQLRFVFEQEKGARRVRDRVENKTWQLASLAPDGKTGEDYAVVTRLFDSATGQLLISAAGITQYGTRAAGEFLTDSRRMTEATRTARADWPKRNLQVLLHTDVYHGTPAQPKILATHVW
jgi:hypothetical protein